MKIADSDTNNFLIQTSIKKILWLVKGVNHQNSH